MIEVRKELASRRVAIVDDNRAFRDIMRVMLRSFGFRRVDVYADPAEVIPVLSQTYVDMLFLDYMMPHMTGIDVAREVRHSRTVVNRNLTIVLVTGHASRGTVISAISAGIDDVLVKPVSPRNVYKHLLNLNRATPGYVSGESDYFGPDIAERRRVMERRLLGDRWQLAQPKRGPLQSPFEGQRPTAAARQNLPGLNARARTPDIHAPRAEIDAYLLD